MSLAGCDGTASAHAGLPPTAVLPISPAGSTSVPMTNMATRSMPTTMFMGQQQIAMVGPSPGSTPTGSLRVQSPRLHSPAGLREDIWSLCMPFLHGFDIIAGIPAAVCKIFNSACHGKDLVYRDFGLEENASTRVAEWTPRTMKNFMCVVGRLLLAFPQGEMTGKRNRGRTNSGKSNGGNTANPTANEYLRKAIMCSDAVIIACERRMHEFTWDDISSIVSAAGKNPAFRTPAFLPLMTQLVVTHAPGRCYEMSTKVMVSIALTALEIGMDRRDMAPMVRDIAGEFARRTPRVKPIELRQWAKIQRAMAA